MIRAEAAANQMVPGPRCQSTAAALIEGRLRVDEESKAAVCTTRTEAIGFRVASDHTRREAVPAMGGMGRPAPTARNLAAHSRTPTEMGVGICVNDRNRTHAQASRRRFENESPPQVDQSRRSCHRPDLNADGTERNRFFSPIDSALATYSRIDAQYVAIAIDAPDVSSHWRSGLSMRP